MVPVFVVARKDDLKPPYVECHKCRVPCEYDAAVQELIDDGLWPVCQQCMAAMLKDHPEQVRKGGRG